MKQRDRVNQVLHKVSKDTVEAAKKKSYAIALERFYVMPGHNIEEFTATDLSRPSKKLDDRGYYNTM